ncbi:MAG: phytanoyl-CoA dioxygenase family protein [Sulfitobacter sp.]
MSGKVETRNALTPDMIDHFGVKGWVPARGYVHKTTLAHIEREAEHLTKEVGQQSSCQYYVDRFANGESRLARVERIAEHLPTLTTSGLRQRMAQDAAMVLKGPVVAFKDKLNIRYPASAGYAPHQDAARWRSFAARFVSFGLFLSASDPERGGFSFAQYDLKAGLQATQTGDFDAAVFQGLPREDITAAPGDALIIDGTAPHCTTRNSGPDRVLHLLFTFALGADEGARDAYYAAQEQAFEQVRSGNVFTFPARQ